MKINVVQTPAPPPAFKPVTLSLTIETEAEAEMFKKLGYHNDSLPESFRKALEGEGMAPDKAREMRSLFYKFQDELRPALHRAVKGE